MWASVYLGVQKGRQEEELVKKEDVVSGEEEGVAGGVQVRNLCGHTCGHDVRIC